MQNGDQCSVVCLSGVSGLVPVSGLCASEQEADGAPLARLQYSAGDSFHRLLLSSQPELRQYVDYLRRINKETCLHNFLKVLSYLWWWLNFNDFGRTSIIGETRHFRSMKICCFNVKEEFFINNIIY